MKYIIFSVLFIYNFSELFAINYQYANCSATLEKKQLLLTLKFYNIITDDNSDEQSGLYDEISSIYIPISEWIFQGNSNNNIINGWDWLNDEFVNIISFIPPSYNYVTPQKYAFDGETPFTLLYSPKFIEVKPRDSVIIKFKLNINDSLFNDLKYSQIFFKIPFIKYSSFSIINDFLDLTDALCTDKIFQIQINPLQKLNLNHRNFSNYSKIKINKAIYSMLKLSVLDHNIICSCSIKLQN